jgi:hypothetical protein
MAASLDMWHLHGFMIILGRPSCEIILLLRVNIIAAAWRVIDLHAT